MFEGSNHPSDSTNEGEIYKHIKEAVRSWRTTNTVIAILYGKGTGGSGERFEGRHHGCQRCEELILYIYP